MNGKRKARRIVLTCGMIMLTSLIGLPHNIPAPTSYVPKDVAIASEILEAFGPMEAYAAELTQSARWVGSGDRWQVSDNAGGFLKNSWFQDDVTGHWYLLGAEDGSVMYAGLVTDQSTGKTYLLNTNHDGTYGRMISTDGVYSLNGKSVHLTFNQNHDGTFGAITSGLSDARSSGVTEKQLSSIPTETSGSSYSNSVNSVPQNDISCQESNSKYSSMNDTQLVTLARSGDQEAKAEYKRRVAERGNTTGSGVSSERQTWTAKGVIIH